MENYHWRIMDTVRHAAPSWRSNRGISLPREAVEGCGEFNCLVSTMCVHVYFDTPDVECGTAP